VSVWCSVSLYRSRFALLKFRRNLKVSLRSSSFYEFHLVFVNYAWFYCNLLILDYLLVSVFLYSS
jgi:hypothetical protein